VGKSVSLAGKLARKAAGTIASAAVGDHRAECTACGRKIVGAGRGKANVHPGCVTFTATHYR
jgi:hypothetical protein